MRCRSGYPSPSPIKPSGPAREYGPPGGPRWPCSLGPIYLVVTQTGHTKGECGHYEALKRTEIKGCRRAKIWLTPPGSTNSIFPRLVHSGSSRSDRSHIRWHLGCARKTTLMLFRGHAHLGRWHRFADFDVREDAPSFGSNWPIGTCPRALGASGLPTAIVPAVTSVSSSLGRHTSTCWSVAPCGSAMLAHWVYAIRPKVARGLGNGFRSRQAAVSQCVRRF